ncbi:MAG TPA: ABC transporter permease [Trebonia sp.]|nr:ABC transporter permease [Trebonia sp.]
MSEFLHFGLLGLGVGALYALSGLGLVVIYRGSGVLNFAQGAMAVAGGLVYYQAKADGLPYGLAVLIAVVATALVGALFHLLVLRGLRNSSAIMRLVATLALLICLQGIATIKYGGNLLYPPTELPQTIVRFGGGVTVSLDRLLLLAAVALATAVMWTVFRFTRFGIATSAVAENQIAAAATGLRPDRIATVNWAFGSALAAVAGILIAPILGLSVLLMTTMVLASLAAALVGGFRSFPLLGAAVFLVLALTLGPTWTDSFTVTFATAIVLLSIVVLTGYAGQLSLGQWALAGMGAYVAGRLVATQHWPFEVAFLAGIAGAALVGVVFAVPAVRTRGVNLAIVTLGLGAAIDAMVFNNEGWTGGFSGTTVGKTTFWRRWWSGACCGRSGRRPTPAAPCCWWNSTSARPSASPTT